MITTILGSISLIYLIYNLISLYLIVKKTEMKGYKRYSDYKIISAILGIISLISISLSYFSNPPIVDPTITSYIVSFALITMGFLGSESIDFMGKHVVKNCKNIDFSEINIKNLFHLHN